MKILRLSLMIAVTVLVMISCSGAPEVNDMPERKAAANPKGPDDLPDWYINIIEEDDIYIYSVGM